MKEAKGWISGRKPGKGDVLAAKESLTLISASVLTADIASEKSRIERTELSLPYSPQKLWRSLKIFPPKRKDKQFRLSKV